MPVNVGWDDANPRTIILFRLFDGWNWDEVKRGVREGNALIDGVTDTVPYIVSVENQLMTPGRFLQNGREVLRGLHPRSGHLVVATRQPLVRELLFIFIALNNGLSGHKYSLVATVQEARDLLGGMGYGSADSGT